MNNYYVQNLEFRLRKIAKRDLLINGTSALEINELGVYIWNLLECEITLDEIIEQIYNNYDVSKDIIQVDVVQFLEFLIKNKAIDFQLI